LERGIEQDHLPVAQELGLGVMTCSALKQGVLSGRYTRQSEQDSIKEWVKPLLTEGTYDLIDCLECIAKAHGAPVSSVALAWVRQKVKPASTIVVVRSCNTLNDHISSVGLQLTDEEMSRLDDLASLELQRKASHQLKPIGQSAGCSTSDKEDRGVIAARFNYKSSALKAMAM
jgi:aryl-alcohol dehydrogenase-like predicted oxidoreductase